MPQNEHSILPTGKAVDQTGGPVVDPTANVIALNDAANKRQDDLRELTNKLNDSKLEFIKEIAEIRSENMEVMAQLRTGHIKELGDKEASRLDAIHQVDALTASTQSSSAQQAISALAATTALNAETLRTSQANLANTIASQNAASFTAIGERITALDKTMTDRVLALERSSYEGKGKDPATAAAMAELISEVKTLREAKAASSGKTEGISLSWGVLVTVITVIAAIAIVYVTNKPSAPQAIYPLQVQSTLK